MSLATELLKLVKQVTEGSQDTIRGEMVKEYNHLPDDFKTLAVGSRIYIHFTRNLDSVSSSPSDGVIGKIVEVFTSGMMVKINPVIVNNKMTRYDSKAGKTVVDFKHLGGEQARHLFVTSPAVKGKAVSAYLHTVDTETANSSLLYIGSMSSHAMDL